MTVRTISTFFALLSFVALAGVIGIIAVALARRSGRMVAESIQPLLVPSAAIVALVATFGSLYMSEVALFEPCLLCWYQRIAMYPLAVILGIAAFRQDTAIRVYAMPIAAIGLAISVYHYLIQAFPALDSGSCSVDVPCAARYLELFGFVSIPFMAGAAFLFVLAALAIAGTRTYDSAQP